MLTFKTSGRAGIIGNPSDGYGGAVLSCGIKNKATVTIKPARELIVTNRFGSRSLKHEEDFENQGDYFDHFRVVLRYFELFDLQAKISVSTSIPEQAGLAGSTAALAALIKTVMSYTGREEHVPNAVEFPWRRITLFLNQFLPYPNVRHIFL